MEEEAIRKLELFHERIERLKENKDFFVNVSVKFDYKEKEGIVSFKGPDPKTVKAFLVDFRLFIANDEPVNFNYICGLVEQESDNITIKEKSRKALKSWNERLERKKISSVGGMKIEIDGRSLLSEENLKMWLNTDYFHLGEKQPELRELLDKIKESPIGLISHFTLIDLVQDLGRLLFWFDENVVVPILGNK